MRISLVLLLPMLAACSATVTDAPPLEIVTEGPLDYSMPAIGELRSSKATKLVVPGRQFAQRQLAWMLPEGSTVKKGDTLARFSPARGEVDLAAAKVSLLRNALTRAGKKAELGSGSARIEADLAQVGTDLSIAEKHANAEHAMIARNDLLDALQDRAYLGEKKGFLGWKRGQTGERGAAELAVLDSQRETHALTAKMRSDDLAALEIMAPHAGVLMLTADWSGERPRVGSTLWASQDFGNIPDPSAMEVQFSLTQLDAAGIKLGALVELAPLGRPQEKIVSKVVWVATAPQAVSRANPIKHVRMKAAIEAADVDRLKLVAGQSMSVRVYAVRAAKGLSVANVALLSEGAQTTVELWRGGVRESRVIRLGERGLARSQVLEGLAPGDAVILTPQREEASS